MSLLENPFVHHGIAVLIPSLLALLLAPVWRKSQHIPIFFCTFTWILGFIIIHILGAMRTSQMLSEHLKNPLSEEELLAIPDGPNITAGWILLGWMAPLLAAITIKIIRLKAQHKAKP